MHDELQALIRIAKTIGNNVALIQGGGGNISAKVQKNKMLIKASGTLLRDLAADSGYALVDCSTLEVLGPTPDARPSMELPMHCLLPGTVIHTHAISANVFNCMVGGEAILKKQFKNFHPLFISYRTPGEVLAREIQRQLERYRELFEKYPQLLFLENHGMITCDRDAQTALTMTLNVNQQLERVLQKQLRHFTPFDPQHYREMEPPPAERCFFPDVAVFLPNALAHTTAIPPTLQEIFAANSYIFETIQALGGTPRPLPKEEVEHLQMMESERYRQGLVKTITT